MRKKESSTSQFSAHSYQIRKDMDRSKVIESLFGIQKKSLSVYAPQLVKKFNSYQSLLFFMSHKLSKGIDKEQTREKSLLSFWIVKRYFAVFLVCLVGKERDIPLKIVSWRLKKSPKL